MSEFYSDEYTEVIQKVVFEVVNDPSTYRGSMYLPSVPQAVNKIRTDVVEASGGTTKDHRPGTNVKYIQSFGTRVQEYSPGYWKEAIHYDEEKILYLRQLGNNGRNIRGIEQYMDIDIDRLNRRLEALQELQRWKSIFDGGFTWFDRTVSFGIPSGNRVNPASQRWSTDGVDANNSANPVQDLRYWVMGGEPVFRKYNISKIVMNPNTVRWILDNENTRTYLTSYGASPALLQYDINKVMNILIPGLPEIDVYNGWYQQETITDGKITVGDATYFIEDGYIFFQVALPGNEKMGEFVQSIHLAEGTVASPGFGKYIVIEDNTIPGSKGGPGNPYIDIIAGVHGGPKLDRPFDVLTAFVGPAS